MCVYDTYAEDMTKAQTCTSKPQNHDSGPLGSLADLDIQPYTNKLSAEPEWRLENCVLTQAGYAKHAQVRCTLRVIGDGEGGSDGVVRSG